MWSNSFPLSTVTSKLSSSIHLSPSPRPSKLGVWLHGFKDIRVNRIIRPQCTPNRKKNFCLQGINAEIDAAVEVLQVMSSDDEINKLVNNIKSMLCPMDDGEEMTASAYDTAWVALVEDINGNGGTPQFPSSLEWIANNQLPDGSWGDKLFFEAHDRLLCTLACVIALKTWNTHPEKYAKGLDFLKENMFKLEEANAEHMTCGFELVFPSLLQKARSLDIEIPFDSPILQNIDARRDRKLSKIPKDIMHKVPTTLLLSLEGMEGLNWEALLELKSKDGSMLSAPSSTAYAFMQTKDPSCFAFLERTVQIYKGGVPSSHPTDLFVRNWAVDRLQRLGISRYFQTEIDDCVDYLNRYWRDEGIGWMADCTVVELDDTCMAFRLLRLHGYKVSPEVLKHFEEDGEFLCFRGQLNEGVTTIMNLYRASQLLFPGETILEDAKKFSYQFLREKQASNQLADKWSIIKDLPGEVEFVMEVPWYASLPRVEARIYIEQYGEDDVWINKTLYRLPKAHNSEYLKLAKLDYNSCQALHLAEWNQFQKWYEECNIGTFGISVRSLLFAYFLAAASIFEPERSKERLAWAKTSILIETIQAYFDEDNNSSEPRKAFVREFKRSITAKEPAANNGRRWILVKILIGTVNHLSEELMRCGRDVGFSLHRAWEQWLQTWEETRDRHQGEAQLLAQIINLTGGHWVSDEELLMTHHRHHHHHQYEILSHITNRVCWQLGHYQKQKVNDCGTYNNNSCCKITTPEIEADMQRLVQLVLENTEDGIHTKIKETFLVVARSFYYAAYCDPMTINNHINKVLFEKIM